MRLADISAPQWRALAMRATEPNGYYLPDWELAIDASARGRVGAFALGAWSDTAELTGLMPVISMWRAYKIPLPALVSADPYGSLSTPLLDRDHAEQAAAEILRQARRSGAHALVLRDTSLDGAAMRRSPRSCAATASPRACCNRTSAPRWMRGATPMNCCAPRSGRRN